MTYLTEAEALTAAELRTDREGYVDFNGMNCDDECIGWDGESRRCSCGNRRVSWETSQNRDGTWSAYAEAY